MTLFLADIWDKTSPSGLGSGVMVIIIVLTIMALVLTVIVLGSTVWTRFIARKPPFDDELAKHNATIEKIKTDLAKLPPSEKFEALVEKLGGFATLNQLAEVKVETDRAVKDVRAYAHEGVHGVRNEFGARISELELDRIERGERMASVEAELKSQGRQLGDIKHEVAQVGKDVNNRVNDVLGAVSALKGAFEQSQRRATR